MYLQTEKSLNSFLLVFNHLFSRDIGVEYQIIYVSVNWNVLSWWLKSNYPLIKQLNHLSLDPRLGMMHGGLLLTWINFNPSNDK